MNSTIGSKSPRATDDSPMAKPSGMPTSAPRKTPGQHPEDADPDVLPERHVAEALGRELHQPVPGRADRRPEERARSSRRPRPPTRARTARATVSSDQIRPESTALASPKRTVFCRVNGLSASPSQTASLPASLRHRSALPAHDLLLHLPDHRQDLLAPRARTRAEALIARGSPASAALREGQARARARSARAAAPSPPAARRGRAPPRPSG